MPDSTKSVESYIASFPPGVQEQLGLIRATIRETAPEATEKISYGVPTFYLNGNLIHYAAFRDHLSLFPGGSSVEAFRGELATYKTSKGTIQLPLNQPLPLDLIRRLVQFRQAQNLERGKAGKGTTHYL